MSFVKEKMLLLLTNLKVTIYGPENTKKLTFDAGMTQVAMIVDKDVQAKFDKIPCYFKRGSKFFIFP